MLSISDGIYKEFINREAVYKGNFKDYLYGAKPNTNEHFISYAKPSKGKMVCPSACRASAGKLCIGPNKLPKS